MAENATLRREVNALREVSSDAPLKLTMICGASSLRVAGSRCAYSATQAGHGGIATIIRARSLGERGRLATHINRGGKEGGREEENGYSPAQCRAVPRTSEGR